VRPARPQIAAVCFVVGLLLVLLIEAPIARIVGVPLTLVGMGLGIVSIAAPDFLEGDREPDQPHR
jgi:disulfide bond formation protein DsbB